MREKLGWPSARHAGKQQDRELDADAGHAAGKLAHMVRGRDHGVAGGSLVAVLGRDELQLYSLVSVAREQPPRVFAGAMVHRLDERGGPVRRVQHDEGQPTRDDPVDDPPAGLRGHVAVPHVAPPDEYPAGIESLVGKTLAGIVQRGRLHRQTALRAQMGGDRVAEKVVVRRLLARLPLVPHQHPDVTHARQ